MLVMVIVFVRPVLIVYIYKVDWPFGHFFVMPHFASHSHHLWNASHRRKKFGIYCLATKSVPNEFVYKKFKQTVPIFKGNLGWILIWMSKRIRFIGGRSSVLDFNGRNLNTTSRELHRRDDLIKFSKSEIEICNNFLQNFGVNSQKGFVCLNFRDDLYNRSISLIKKEYDLRNSETQTYVAAAEKLTELGYTVFRMGAVAKEPLNSTNPKVIDYATNGMRTEMLDVYLGAFCKFAISVGSGWDSVPQIFRRPLLFVNHIPMFALSSIVCPITIFPKIIINHQSQNPLRLLDIIDSKACVSLQAEVYKNAGFEIRDLSSEELVEAVTEMAQRVEGTFVETPEQKEMQSKLKHIFSTHPKLQPSPNYYTIRAQFASCFLSRFPNFLE
jgi:putative glycosyltransferase (TIGR04372 family)